jgi:hypothetical protein
MSFKSLILVSLAAASAALANNGTAPAIGETAGHASVAAGPSDNGAYFAPFMRFDANSGNLEVTFGIDEAARVSLQAFDTQGKLLAVLLDADRGSGFHHLSLFSNRLQGYQGHVIFQLRAGQSVLAETRLRAR